MKFPSLGRSLSLLEPWPAWVDRRRGNYPIEGRRILITGGSSGIGSAAAQRLAALGAEVVVVARRAAELDEVCARIIESGGKAEALVCDLTDAGQVDELVARVGAQWGGVDVLVNNAGRSIRRPVVDSLDRFHDFERVMAVNYFGPVRLTNGLLPLMVQQGHGHIVNVGTWGVPAGIMPKFAAYHASKAALTAYGRSLAAETADLGISVTAVHFPLVRTPMIEPTTDFRESPALRPDRAAEWIVDAIRTRPVAVQPRYVTLLGLIEAVAPARVASLLMDAS
ncbi:SDR family oxidoreductase [Nocardia stercoris]|uniref:SDR family oxidoreductase n=1 Tax=Nocardia stercoris TaxID=2483361 RepID=A0A3M2LCN4_9NOCA|nr:SDR family oxidoreductase [Nocardia stercoris]RMI35242.1 SDR family oxidoreductase [Nocardia stercoris]